MQTLFPLADRIAARLVVCAPAIDMPASDNAGTRAPSRRSKRRAMDSASSSIDTPAFTRRTFAWASTSLLNGMSRDDDRVIF